MNLLKSLSIVLIVPVMLSLALSVNVVELKPFRSVALVASK